MKNIVIARLIDSQFVSANELYDGAVRTLCDAYAFGSDTMSRIVFFDSIKAPFIDGRPIICHCYFGISRS
jgi:predicted protein tyrosine phosphatase